MDTRLELCAGTRTQLLQHEKEQISTGLLTCSTCGTPQPVITSGEGVLWLKAHSRRVMERRTLGEVVDRTMKCRLYLADRPRAEHSPLFGFCQWCALPLRRRTLPDSDEVYLGNYRDNTFCSQSCAYQYAMEVVEAGTRLLW